MEKVHLTLLTIATGHVWVFVSLFCFQLLVNNKIISLDLPVAEVYKKVWCPTNEVLDVTSLPPSAFSVSVPSKDSRVWGSSPPLRGKGGP